MSGIFNTYLYKPILSVLVFIYNHLAFHDFGVSIIFLTLFVRIVLFPLFYKGAKDQALMQRLQPHIKKIQLDHKDNKEEQARKLMELYKGHRLNPFSGVFLLFLQLPILIALYQVFLGGLTSNAFGNLSFLGLIDLKEKNLALAIVAGILQYVQSKFSMPGGSVAGSGKMMLILGPLLTLFILSKFPAALGMYWAASSLISLGQQVIINRNMPPKEHGNDATKSSKTS